MSDEPDGPRDEAYLRPADPAGTRPKVDPDEVVPADLAPLIPDAETEGEAVEIDEDGEEIVARSGFAMVPDAAPAEPSTALAIAESGGGLARPLPQEPPHGSRFQFILGALLAVGASAAVLTVLVLHSNRVALPAAWSSWQPTSGGYAGAAQIANHVAPEYRLPNGQQMLAVSGGPPVLDGVPVTFALSSSASGNVSVLTGNGVLYTMCGLGNGCSIAGKPSAARLQLVKREALELALYTFHYLGADDVVVLIPPVVVTGAGKPSQKVAYALFFRPPDLAAELTRPLSRTLQAPTPTVTTVLRAADTPLVEQLTGSSSYTFQVDQSQQNGSFFLVLQH
jgi:hypothetical protein